MRLRLLPTLILTSWFTLSAMGDEPRESQIRDAIQRCLPWLEKGAAGASAHNKCFTCHNHGLPMMALTEAKERQFKVSVDSLQNQVTHTSDFLDRGVENYRKGRGQGGRVLTAGYALWALSSTGHSPNETTKAVADYLLGDQADRDHWKKSGRRPPSDGNEFTVTYVAVKGLSDYGRPNSEAQQTRLRRAREWAEKTSPQDTEDSVFRLRTLLLTKSEKQILRQAVDKLLSDQRKDGGWGQTDDMDSDAYATGTVLTTLLDSGVGPEQTAIQKGISFLLKSQQENGTWFVKTRANGFQEYYESGFPHGEDQFISIAASSWAVRALLRTLPASETTDSTTPD